MDYLNVEYNNIIDILINVTTIITTYTYEVSVNSL